MRRIRYDGIGWVVEEWLPSASPFQSHHWKELARYPKLEWAEEAERWASEDAK